jgi:hypothetical protein
MPTFRTACTALAALTIPGITHNYDLDQLPDELSRAQLPALLILPLMLEDLPKTDHGTAYQAIAFSSGPRTVTYRLTHLLLLQPRPTGRGSRTQLPALVTAIDNYIATLAAHPTLSDQLTQPAHIEVIPRYIPYGGLTYLGCAFHHTWHLQV